MFIVDKDFTQLSSIEKYFPGRTILLCVLCWLLHWKRLKRKMNYMLCLNEWCMHQVKNRIMPNFIEESTGVQIRINQTYRSLQDYYRKNWETCKKMWVKCFRKYLPILGDNTTNKVERTFWSLKQSRYIRWPSRYLEQYFPCH